MPSALPGQVEKPCCRCGRILPLEAYGRDARCRDGHRPDCRECRKVSTKGLRAADPERYAGYGRAWRERNPEAVKKAYCRYRQNHKERIRTRRRHYYQNNKERLKARGRENMRIWRKRNPEAVREQSHRYYQKNQERLKARSREYARSYRRKYPDRVRVSKSQCYLRHYLQNRDKRLAYSRAYEARPDVAVRRAAKEQERRARIGRVVRLDADIFDMGGRDFHEMIADPRALNPQEELVVSDLLAWTREALTEQEVALLSAFQEAFDLEAAAAEVEISLEAAEGLLAGIRDRALARFGDMGDIGGIGGAYHG